MKKSASRIFIFVLFCAGFTPLLHAQPKPAAPAPIDALARQLETAMQKHDAVAATALLNMDAFLDRIAAGVDADPEFDKGFRGSFKPRGSDLLGGVINAMGADGSYRLIRTRQINGLSHALFRLLTNDGKVNYHEWLAGTDASGRVKFVDFYVALSGEMLSQTIHRVYVMGAVQSHPTLLQRLSGADKEMASNSDQMLKLINTNKAGQPEEALKIYRSMPKSMQENKSIMLVRFNAAYQLLEKNPSEYNNAVADFQRLFPNDPCLDLMRLDMLVNAGKYREAGVCLNHIEAFTGPDAYLDFLRGNICVMAGGDQNFALAKKLFRKSIDAEPLLAQPYWGLVTLSLKAKQFDDTAATLNEIERKLPVKIQNLEANRAYAEFVKSEAYKKWKVAREAGAKVVP